MFYDVLYHLRESVSIPVLEKFDRWLFTELQKHPMEGMTTEDYKSRDGVKLLWKQSVISRA